MKKIYNTVFENILLRMPLNKDNRIDLISGGSVVGGSTYCKWDDSSSCYMFTQQAGSFSIAATSHAENLSLPFIVPYIPNFTREYDFLPLSSTYGNIFVLGHGNVLSNGVTLPFTRIFTISSSGSDNYVVPGTWCHIKEVFSNGYYKYYKDGVLKISSQTQTITDTNLSSTIMCFSCGMYNNGVSGVKFGMKNLTYYEGEIN